MTNPLKGVTTRTPVTTTTPQSEKAVKGQKKNPAGGFVFTISPMERAKRFLILGSEGSFYKSGAALSKENAKNLIKVIEKGHSTELVDLIVEISDQGRAAKQTYGVFALAVAAATGTPEEKAYALSKLEDVARTGTTLFQFAGFVEQFRGWGPGLRKAIAKWYQNKTTDQAAYQAVKYQNREGYSHRDLFRLSHPVSGDAGFKGLGEWILRGKTDEAPAIVKGFAAAQKADLKDLPALIRQYGLSWEMLPTEALNETKVWDALLDGNVPLGALVRQLPRLTRIGVVAPMGAGQTAKIVARLTDADEIAKSRQHPLQLLISLKTYAAGQGRGGKNWTPVKEIIDALDKAFYLSFKTVVPAGKRTLIGLDISGSMGYGEVAGVEGITAREATAAMALVTMATEPFTQVIGFTGYGPNVGGTYWGTRGTATHAEAVKVLDISPRQRLDDVVAKISGLPMGPTDCALPMQYAMEKGLKIDTFLILTDNDTWIGSVHPFEALKQYRAKTGIPAKLIVMSTEATQFSIADPDDAGMLDIPGFDSAAPAIVAEFSKGF